MSMGQFSVLLNGDTFQAKVGTIDLRVWFISVAFVKNAVVESPCLKLLS
jgi:hypothetical protein